MGIISYDTPQTYGKGTKLIYGSFAPNGSSAVSAASNRGRGWTVARTSAGLFTVTFTDKYPECISASSTIQLATGDDKFVQVGTVTVGTSTNTATIRVWDISAAAETDVAANANNRINFIFAFRKTSAAPTRG